MARVQEVVGWSRGSGDYTSTVLHSAGRGRIQAADVGGGSLYAEMGSWVDPGTIEAQLQAAAQRRKRALTPAEVREVRQRKQESKEKKQRSWLLS